MLTVGSLFSGIGGLELGLERAGMTTIWQVEKNEFCQQILDKHWPNVPTYGDITTVDFKEITTPDALCGGFPCQDLSWMGPGDGLDGERSGLWEEYYRAICILRPRYIIVENVSAITHRGLDAVLGSLAKVGYDAWWDHLPAAFFGAPHRRDRWFLVAYPTGERRFGDFLRMENVDSSDVWTETKKWCQDRTYSPVGAKTIEGLAFKWRERDGKPPILRVVDGLPRQLDRLRALGNAVVPQVAQFVGRCVVRHHKESKDAQ